MKSQVSKKVVPHSPVHVWLMSFICVFFVVLAAAAATRLPHFLETADSIRVIGTVLFSLLAVAGLGDNIHTHYLVWQRQNSSKVTQLATQN
ncbi:MAG: hypothetical protein H6656_15875 [Ardenticatenaceae bacterium]|nr:hypothetical protein [Anaerolineales bacterium]MCB9008819.1 hypothetical protein [Ardenticatenaceae bacterium]